MEEVFSYIGKLYPQSIQSLGTLTFATHALTDNVQNFERFSQVNSQGSFTFVTKNSKYFSLIISPRELGGSSPHLSLTLY